VSGWDYPELFADLAAQVAEQIIERGMAEEQVAKEIGAGIAEYIREHWSGINMYIPKGRRMEELKRDATIYDEYSGSNAQELARKYGMALASIYRIVARERDRRQEKLDI